MAFLAAFNFLYSIDWFKCRFYIDFCYFKNGKSRELDTKIMFLDTMQKKRKYVINRHYFFHLSSIKIYLSIKIYAMHLISHRLVIRKINLKRIQYMNEYE